MAKRKSKQKITPMGVVVSGITTICIILYALIFSPDLLPQLISTILGENPSNSVGGNLPADGTLQVHVIDIGQGDCTLIIGPDKTVLIDAGENNKGEIVTSYLKAQGIKKIDLMVATHTHSDHMGGLDVVLNNFEVGTIAMPSIPDALIPTTKTFTDFLTAAKNSGASTKKITEPFTMDLGGGGSITVFAPSAKATDVNNTSLYTRVSFGKADFLNTGDAETSSEKSVLTSPYLQGIEVLGAGHHGSNTSSSAEFLNVVKPVNTYISLGKDNKYGHPHKEPMERLSKIGSTINRTDLEGNIVYTTDGKSIIVKSSTFSGKVAIKE